MAETDRKKPLCTVVVADVGYQEFIPLYLYFLFTAYPEYEALVYFDGPMYPEVRDCLDRLQGMGRFTVKRIPFDYDRSSAMTVKSIRWVVHEDELDDYEYVYIGDIDILIVREEPSLCDVHSAQCRAYGLPYSNRARRGTRKLTGLHFLRTADYYPRVLPLMEKTRRLIETRALDLFNEELLYRMMRETFGLPPRHGVRPHHGIHLKAFHAERDLAQQRERTDYQFAKAFEPHYRGFMAAAAHPLFELLVQRLAEIPYTEETLQRYPRGGPAALRQLRAVERLCAELEAERQAVDTATSRR